MVISLPPENKGRGWKRRGRGKFGNIYYRYPPYGEYAPYPQAPYDSAYGRGMGYRHGLLERLFGGIFGRGRYGGYGYNQWNKGNEYGGRWGRGRGRW